MFSTQLALEQMLLLHSPGVAGLGWFGNPEYGGGQ